MENSEKNSKFISIKESDKESESLLESALKERLKLTVEQRIESHENARRLVSDLQRAGESLRARSNKAS